MHSVCAALRQPRQQVEGPVWAALQATQLAWGRGVVARQPAALRTEAKAGAPVQVWMPTSRARRQDHQAGATCPSSRVAQQPA